jgi:hypothetical protein
VAAEERIFYLQEKIIGERMNIAIVLAKGPERKERNINLYLVESHPVIYYSISAALGSKNIDRVFVATDDKNIAEIAEGLSCSVLKRPKTLKTMGAAIVYSAKEIIKTAPSCKNIVLLSGNNSMVSSYLIEKSIGILERERGAKSVITVWEARHDHPECALILKDRFLNPYLEKGNKEGVYFYDGSICAIRSEIIENECFKDKKWWTKLPNCIPLIRPWPTGRDIHDSYGLSLARWWIKNSPVDTASEIK